VKEQETIQQFIDLRSQGISFAKIAAMLGVAKSTLILWSRQHQHHDGRCQKTLQCPHRQLPELSPSTSA